MPSIAVQPSPVTRAAPAPAKPAAPTKAATPPVAPPAPARPAAPAAAPAVAKASESRSPVPASTGLYDNKGRIETPAAAPSPKTEAPRAAAPVPAPAASPAPAPATDPSGALFASSDRFSVEIQASDSGYANRIVWSSDGFKTMNDIGIDNQNVGTVQTMTVARGARVEFGIISGDGRLYRAGPASLNADGVVHATVTGSADSFTLGFEDLYGGGDRDFNDAIIRVKGLAASPVADARAPEPKPAAGASAPAPGNAAPAVPAAGGTGGPANTGNRSGLGDGTNPGQGAGRANSPNEGTLNPNQSGGATAERNSRLLDAAYGTNGAGNAGKDTPGAVAPAPSPAVNKPADKLPAAPANSQKEQQATADARKLKEQADAKRLKDEADAKKLKEAADAQKAKEAAEAKLKAAAAAAAAEAKLKAADAAAAAAAAVEASKLKAAAAAVAGKGKDVATVAKVNEPVAAAGKAAEAARKTK